MLNVLHYIATNCNSVYKQCLHLDTLKNMAN